MPEIGPGTGRLTPVYIGLGANLGSRRATLARAVQDIDRIPGVMLVAQSSIYESAPMGPQDQPDYLNAVVAVLTDLSPPALLKAMQDIERAHGRRRGGERWGPRSLDLDLLVYGSLQSEGHGLDIPHPGLVERNFVLYPLAEIAPRLMVPGAGIAEELAGAVGSVGLIKLE